MFPPDRNKSTDYPRPTAAQSISAVTGPVTGGTGVTSASQPQMPHHHWHLEALRTSIRLGIRADPMATQRNAIRLQGRC